MPKETNKKQSKDTNKKHRMKDFKAELKKVVWPTPKQLANNTMAVISIVLLIAVIVFALDFTFETINTYGIERLKTVVENNNSTTENNTVDTSAGENATTENTETTGEENTAANEEAVTTNTVNE